LKYKNWHIRNKQFNSKFLFCVNALNVGKTTQKGAEGACCRSINALPTAPKYTSAFVRIPDKPKLILEILTKNEYTEPSRGGGEIRVCRRMF